MIIEKKGIGMKFVHLFFILFCASCIIPFILITSISLSNEDDILMYGFKLIPRNIDLTSYKLIFANPENIINGYKVTIFISVVGTFLSILLMSLAGYALSRRNFKFRNQLTLFLFITMLFSGGLVPSYILNTKYLGLNDSIWVMVIPGLVSAYPIFMFRTFFQDLPDSLMESAKLDGASEWRIFASIIIPLSKPIIATMALFGVLGRWNEWFSGLLYIQSEEKYPLQYLLQRILSDVEYIRTNIDKIPPTMRDSLSSVPTESLKMALCIVVVGPMMFVFPFFQKYFVRGITVGSIKG